MLEEELIKYETSKLAHKKGFDGICLYQYRMNKEDKPYLYETPYYEGGYSGRVIREDLIEDGDILAPSQSLLQRWLREVHNIHIDIYRNGLGFQCNLDKSECGTHICRVTEDTEDTYEEALEAGLLKALELVE